MELEVNIQERKTASRKALSLGNGTTHCMQPPTTASQTCCLSPLFSYHCGQLWGIIRSQKQDIVTILGHISYLLLLNTYIILSRMMSSDYRFVNQVCRTFFVGLMISIYPIYNVNNNTKNIYMQLGTQVKVCTVNSWYITTVVLFIKFIHAYLKLVLTDYFLFLIIYLNYKQVHQ